MSPRFSVLLPTHDGADVVGFAIESVLAQIEPDFELLIVGDGCTDDTADIVRRFDDTRIRWYDLPKAPGFGYANRNIALREAKGELIAFMAHDDLLLPDHLQLMGSIFGTDRVEWAYSRPLWMGNDGTAAPTVVDLRRPSALETFMTVGNSIPASCVVHRRSCLDRYGYWPEELPKDGDYDLWKRILRPTQGTNLDYLPTPTCIHFRARWRTGPTWGPYPLSSPQPTDELSAWPADLCLDIPADLSPQSYVWQQLSDDPASWSRGIRDAVVDAIDGMAWDARVQRQLLARETARADGLDAARGRQAERVTALEHEVVALKPRLAQEVARNTSLLGSRSWKAMAPARLAGSTLRRVRQRLSGG